VGTGGFLQEVKELEGELEPGCTKTRPREQPALK